MASLSPSERQKLQNTINDTGADELSRGQAQARLDAADNGIRTMAIGEDDPNRGNFEGRLPGPETDPFFNMTTAALGEEDGSGGTPYQATTRALGEDGSGGMPIQETTMAVGEEDGSGMEKMTTMMAGEEDGLSKITNAQVGGEDNMVTKPVTDIQDTIEKRAGATTLPTGTKYTPEVQKVQDNELLTEPSALDTTDKVTPSLVSTENLDVTVPTKQNAETYSANTIAGTPEAIAAQGKLSSESVIGDVQGAVSKESLAEAAQGEVSEASTVKYQLGELFSSFEEGKPLPAWAAPAVRNVGAMMQARGLGASSMASAAITQAIMESGIPIAKADADRYGQMDMANLNNQQQSVMQNAMTYASMDKANLDARMQVAVNNAKSFLSMDLQNLSNEQKMQEIDYAGQLQSLTSNQAAENSAAQFNAQSQNQIDEFFAELGSQVETGNKNRMAAQEQFNANEKNATSQYNASLNDARERFNTQMATQIAQSNAVWRREINTAETANQNAANQMNAQNLLGITQSSLDALWQRYRDEAGWALKIAEGQEQRFHEIGLLSMEIDANTELYEMESDATFSTELGKSLLNGIFGIGSKFLKQS